MAKEENRHDTHRERLKALATKLARKHGKNILMPADENPYSDIPWLPTGIFAVDYALGGGFPKGRIGSCFGEYSSSKTLLLLKLVAMSQMICRVHNTLMLQDLSKPLLRCPTCGSRSKKEVCEKCSDKKIKVMRENCGDFEMSCPVCGFFNPHRAFWVDMEGVYSNTWAALLGVDAEYVDVSRPEYAEQAIDAYELTLRELDVDISVIDSIAALTPLGEIQDTAEKMQVGVQARLVNRLMRQAVSLQNSDDLRKDGRVLTQIFINQVREKVGLMFGDPIVRPGGRGQEFVSSAELRMRRNKTYSPNDDPVLSLFSFVVTKNKTGMPPKRVGSFRLWHDNYDGHPPGWTNEPMVVAKAMQKSGWALSANEDGKLIETLPLGQELLNDAALTDVATAHEACLKKGLILSSSDVAARIEKDLQLWWKVRTTLFQERLGKVEEELEDASH